jgi:hypothetical protein
MNNNTKLKAIALGSALLSSITFSGCSFSNSDIIEDTVGTNIQNFVGKHQQGIGTLAATSNRRMILVDLNSSKYCAEPEPITANSITSKLDMALKATKGDKEATINVIKSFESMSNQLFKASQGLSFSQVLAFNLCQAKRNGDIKDSDFNITFNKIIDTSSKIILSENNTTRLQLQSQKDSKTLSALNQKIKISNQSISSLNKANNDLNISNQLLLKEIEVLKKCDNEKLAICTKDKK